MTNIDFWPSLTFLFEATNLAAWYFHSAPLFSWWWLALVAGAQILLSVLVLAVMKIAVER